MLIGLGRKCKNIFDIIRKRHKKPLIKHKNQVKNNKLSLSYFFVYVVKMTLNCINNYARIIK